MQYRENHNEAHSSSPEQKKILYANNDGIFGSTESELPSYLLLAGYHIEYSKQRLKDLGFDPLKVAEYIQRDQADAWIVICGSELVISEIAEMDVPIMCVFGYVAHPKTAGIGPSHISSIIQCIENLVGLGHRRIVLFTREECRRPKLAKPESMILDAFKKHGLTNESELLPDWEENLTGFRKCLESHLKEDPVTAIILQEADLLMLAQQFLLERGLSIPNDVSLFCSDYSPAFDWSDPPISHSRWNQQKVIHRVIEWTRNISSGKRDTEKEIFDADFVEGGSIGPAPSSDWDSDTRGKVW